jgi:toxin YoeB
MNKVTFTHSALKQFESWVEINPRVASKLIKLIMESAKNPYDGNGNPERLNHELNEFWSRRINNEHRLVYKVENDSLIIVSCIYHYQ